MKIERVVTIESISAFAAAMVDRSGKKLKNGLPDLGWVNRSHWVDWFSSYLGELKKESSSFDAANVFTDENIKETSELTPGGATWKTALLRLMCAESAFLKETLNGSDVLKVDGKLSKSIRWSKTSDGKDVFYPTDELGNAGPLMEVVDDVRSGGGHPQLGVDFWSALEQLAHPDLNGRFLSPLLHLWGNMKRGKKNTVVSTVLERRKL